MNQDDKVKHIEAAQKDVSAVCFDLCFSNKKFILDFTCVSNCYHKYLFAANHIQKLVVQEGRECRSDFVV